MLSFESLNVFEGSTGQELEHLDDYVRETQRVESLNFAEVFSFEVDPLLVDLLCEHLYEKIEVYVFVDEWLLVVWDHDLERVLFILYSLCVYLYLVTL